MLAVLRSRLSCVGWHHLVTPAQKGLPCKRFFANCLLFSAPRKSYLLRGYRAVQLIFDVIVQRMLTISTPTGCRLKSLLLQPNPGVLTNVSFQDFFLDRADTDFILLTIWLVFFAFEKLRILSIYCSNKGSTSSCYSRL